MEGLPDLLAASDFVVIAAPHTPETAGLFDARMIGRMKPSGYLINIGRGAIVVLDDLVAALRAGTIAGAALDVFEVEPLPPDHSLWDFPQRHPHAPHRRLFARDRSTPPRGRWWRTSAGSPGTSRRSTRVDKALWF